MPVTNSAYKRMRSSKKRHARNTSAKSELKTLAKKFDSLAASGNVKEAETICRSLTAKADRAAVKRIIPKNTAARLKSRISRRLHLLAHPDK